MEQFSPGEIAEFRCAHQHVLDKYRLPRYLAAEVAALLLTGGWHPVCTHAGRRNRGRLHYFSDYKRHGRNRPVPWYVRPVPEEELGVNDAVMFANFRALMDGLAVSMPERRAWEAGFAAGRDLAVMS